MTGVDVAESLRHGELPMTDGSRWSWRSRRSILCIASEDSVLSIASRGSVLSIGSIGSAMSSWSVGSMMSAWSIGSFQSAGSVLSAQASGSVLAFQANGALLGRRTRGPLHGAALPLALAALGVGMTALRVRALFRSQWLQTHSAEERRQRSLVRGP